MDYQQLLAQHERLADVARDAASACEALARNANGRRGHVIPAPSAYELLGNLKLMLWSLNEVVGFMPTGLANSLSSADITVVDRDFATGRAQDPTASIAAASNALQSMSSVLAKAAEFAEQAQGAIDSQGYEPTHTTGKCVSKSGPSSFASASMPTATT